MAKHTPRGGSPALSQRRYTPEFKRDAVALYETSGKSIAAVARELGMNDVTLGAWIHDQEKGRRTAETAADRAEAARLRKQIKELEDEIEILKRFTSRPGVLHPAGRRHPWTALGRRARTLQHRTHGLAGEEREGVV